MSKPLEGGPGHKITEQKPTEDTAKVVYIGRIPHGFYEKEMEGAFLSSCYKFIVCASCCSMYILLCFKTQRQINHILIAI